MLRLVLVTLTIVLALTGTTLERMDKPKLVIQDLTSIEQYTFMVNQTVQIDFPTQFTAYEGRVYDRDSPYNQSNFYQDFTQNPQLYEESQNCEFVPAYFDVETEQEELVISDYKLIGHVVNWKTKCTYVLTDNFTVLKTCANGNAKNLYAKEQEIKELGKIEGVTANSLGGIFLQEDSQQLYVFTQTSLFTWNGGEFVPVIGYVQNQYSERIEMRGNQLFLLQPFDSIIVYNFTDAVHCQLVSTVRKWKQNNLSPVDFKFINDDLWVLDSEFGLYTYSLKFQNPDAKNSYLVRFGKKLFFETNENVTFMIAFELNGDTYVAEMAMINDVLILNRFYDKVNGVNAFLFFEQRLAIVGQQEMMTIQHSTNPALLADTWQDKSFYAMFGLIHLQPRRGPASPSQGVFFTMIKNKSLYAVTYERSFATVTCEFRNSLQVQQGTVYMQINSTVCRKNERANMSLAYCNIRFSLNYKIVGVVSSLVSLIITIVIIVLAVLIFACLLISAKRMKSRKQLEIEELQRELEKKMEQRQKKQASQGALRQQV